MDKTRIRKTIAILLAVLFLVSLTAGAVSAKNEKMWEFKPVAKTIAHNVVEGSVLKAGLEVTKDKNPLLHVANKDSDDTSQVTIMAGFFGFPFAGKEG